jgi:chemotaxis protein CheX
MPAVEADRSGVLAKFRFGSGDFLPMIPAMESPNPEIAPMIDGIVRDVISTMTRIPIARSEQDPTPHSFGVNGLAGVVGLAGSLAANVHLVLSQATSHRLVAGMVGIDDLSDSDVRDGIGEFTNMIAGGLKNRLDVKGFRLRLTVPTLLRGMDVQVTAKGFTFGSTNLIWLEGDPEPMRVAVFAKMDGR